MNTQYNTNLIKPESSVAIVEQQIEEKGKYNYHYPHNKLVKKRFNKHGTRKRRKKV